MTLDNLSSCLFSSLPYLPCHAAFGKKTFSPLSTALCIGCTAGHTQNAVKSLNTGKFGNFFGGGDFGQSKKTLGFNLMGRDW